MRKGSVVLGVVMASLLIVLFPFTTMAAETCKPWIAKAVSVQGHVDVKRTGEARWQVVRLNDIFCPGDTIRVQEKSRTAIVLMNESTLRLDQNTTITFSKIVEEKTSFVDLITGILHIFSRVPRSIKVVTPFVNGTVEGTEFLVRVESDKTSMIVYEGQVVAMNEAGSITLTSGQSAIAERDKAPVLTTVVRPRDAVQWALYYPPVSHKPQADWQTKVASLLSVGRVDEARKEIEQLLTKSPHDSDALAFLSVIALVQNEKDKTLDLSKKAIEADPSSSAARIALSYALQAHFDLQGALESLKEAVNLEPENALAWARLAELWMSLGNLDEALRAASKAVAMNPNLARTQTVLGYVYLSQIKTKTSREAFEKAIELDQADPLPRLGLGLAKIRDGELEPGRGEIEIAASLDPNESIIRSYLGKAFYEEKREQKASNQYTAAKELDPRDPTPFFYDAILKQSLNRPVEALNDLQKAIELNDNRSIYRSKLLLDSDLAARSASLARIYNDLGFQQAALVEGWKSVNTDPANFSAHRFLSDTYAVLPRHEIARVSELLQSQLLQPINITPVQPSLAEANLFILNGAGPSDPGFNEFNPLFNRNRLSLQLSGITGSNKTLGEEVVVSGIYDKFSISTGQFHYETNGFRANNDQKQDIYNVFAQYSFSDKTSVQAEFRSTDTEKGDLELRFLPGDFSKDLRQGEDAKSVRLGFHHNFLPGSDVIGSFIYKNAETTLHNTQGIAVLDGTGDENSYSAELQYLFRSERFNLISGAGYFSVDRKNVITSALLMPPFLNLSTSVETNISHTNLYLYSNINYPEPVTLTAGGSADFFHGGIVDRNQFNPKLGLTWNLSSSTTIRAAAFRIVKRTLITDQTLEPTQVAGFNQFFDYAEGTDAWRYGIAADQKFSRDISGGLEYSRSDLKVPFQYTVLAPPPSPPISEVRQADWKERQARAYLYWTPLERLAVTAEYYYEHLDRGTDFTAGIEHVKTHRFPLGISFFHPSGFSAQMKATYIDQDGRFQPINSPTGTIVSGADHFWIADASISYRLPKRFGIITIEGKNLLNKSFMYQDTDPANPLVAPKRSVFARLTLSF